MLRPTRLTRYVLYELAAATLLGISVWTVFLLLNDLFFIARAAIQKDLGLALQGARELGVALPQTANAAQLMQACAANGMADLDHSALVRALELMADHAVAEA